MAVFVRSSLVAASGRLCPPIKTLKKIFLRIKLLHMVSVVVEVIVAVVVVVIVELTVTVVAVAVAVSVVIAEVTVLLAPNKKRIMFLK